MVPGKAPRPKEIMYDVLKVLECNLTPLAGLDPIILMFTIPFSRLAVRANKLE